jgi:hypothetical protein
MKRARAVEAAVNAVCDLWEAMAQRDRSPANTDPYDLHERVDYRKECLRGAIGKLLSAPQPSRRNRSKPQPRTEPEAQ